MIDLTENEQRIIIEILERLIPDAEVWAFGSRVQGTGKPFSDLDLVLRSKTPIEFSTLAELRDAFSESDLPFRVDVIDWAVTAIPFQNLVQAAHIVLRPSAA